MLSRTRDSVTSIVESLGDKGQDADGASGSNSMGRRGSGRDNGEGDVRAVGPPGDPQDPPGAEGGRRGILCSSVGERNAEVPLWGGHPVGHPRLRRCMASALGIPCRLDKPTTEAATWAATGIAA